MADKSMAKFGHTLISGIVWIAIAIGIGYFGFWLTKQSDSLAILGWPIAIIGYGFAGMTILHVWRITSMQLRGMRMMRADPEGFEEAKRSYEETMRRIDDKGNE